ncbi:MAG: sulfotransferase domain-containing protein, partial [Gammaproteobacteria bacterium]|nr:sulfotransferase domain-containing protein [Gammaproteobacteria bacterium]
MKKPNFFIIGAPKCGTTSLANWLREHPNIFMPEHPKEPMFFDTDITKHNLSLQQYEKLFHNTNKSHIAVGEASTTYLRSKVAIDKILEYSLNAKFIITVRNPVEMAISGHSQMLYTLHEDITDFQEAWEAQKDRKEGKRIPKKCKDQSHKLFYGEVCKIGEQLNKVYQSVSQENIKVIFLDDLKNNPAQTYNETLEFLNVPNDERQDFSAANTRKKPKKVLLSHTLYMLGKTKRALGLQGINTGILAGIHKW